MKINQFLVGDAAKIMRDQIPNNFVDLTITSPPYDNMRSYKGFEFDYKGIFDQLFRVTKDGGVVVWIVGDSTKKGSESGSSFRQALYAKDIGFNLHDTMIYFKKGGLNSGSLKCYQQKFEYMFVFAKGKIKTHNLIKDRKNIHTEPRVKRKRQKNGQYKEQIVAIKEYGTRYNIWEYQTGKGHSTNDEVAFRHPAIFPDQLAKDHILSWSTQGDTILDPMCGAGTTCKMAWLNQRGFIGIDISEDYINNICVPRLNIYDWEQH